MVEKRGMKMRTVMVAAIAAAMLAGCTHETYIVDAKHPEVEYTENGDLKWHRRFIHPEDLPRLLEKSGVSHKAQIDIRVPERMHSLKGPRQLLFMLRKAGYTRGVLVTEKRAYSKASEPPPPPPQARPQPRKIRYK